MDLDRPELTWLALAAAREQRPDEPLKLAPDPLLLRTGIGPAELEQLEAEATRLSQALKQEA